LDLNSEYYVLYLGVRDDHYATPPLPGKETRNFEPFEIEMMHFVLLQLGVSNFETAVCKP
jgi:hypothetical protein